MPGKSPIAARQISRRWHRLVKTKYSREKEAQVTEDFYALKHLFLDLIDEQMSSGAINLAQGIASHRS